MAYTTLADVRSAAPQIEFSGFSKPTEDDVTRWIVDVEATLDGALRNLGYVLPLDVDDHPLSFAILRDMVVHAVIARVLQARLWGVSEGVDTSGALSAQKYFDDRLKWLQDPLHPFELPDAPQSTLAAGKPRSWGFGAFEEDTDYTSTTGPRVRMRQKF